jgi:hypothetical protein
MTFLLHSRSRLAPRQVNALVYDCTKWYHRPMTTTTDRRPRIREDVAANIDKRRGSVPFERYVNSVLEHGDPPTFTLERTKDRDMHRLVAAEMRGNAYGLVEATDRMDFLNYVSTAMTALDNADTIDRPRGDVARAFDDALAAIEELWRASSDAAGVEYIEDES